MSKRQGLGRGLDSLIPSKKDRDDIDLSWRKAGAAPVDFTEKDPLEVPVSKIKPNPMQPRTDFKRRDLEDLMNSIREHGIIQPLVVSRDGDDYILIAGERRLRSAKMLGLEKVPVVVRQAEGDRELLELALIENIQRSDLNPMERAEGYRNLMEKFGLTQEEAGKKLGKSRPAVANALRLLDLPDEIQDALAEGRITEGHAKAILAFEVPEKQLKLFKRIMADKLSVRETEGSVKRMKSRGNPTEADPNISEKEAKIRDALGTRASIKAKGGRGRITIEFYSPEELKSIVEKICT